MKRLFFGIEVEAPWPHELPSGRILDEKDRHITLAFLGNTDYLKLKEVLSEFPKPTFKVGFVGKFDQCLFFPKRHPHVVAWHTQILEEHEELLRFQKELVAWLNDKGFCPDCKHDFTPHITLARSPFDQKKWEETFIPLPFILKDIHLYESVGNLKYSSIWHWTVSSPIESIEHTADLAFFVRGKSYNDLYLHASIALAFTFPEMMSYIVSNIHFSSLDQVIRVLNEMVFQADTESGCPFKAVSFHTDMKEKDQLMEWEMIIDV